MTIPESLSIDPAYPGYRDDALLVGANLLISLDGVEQKEVIAYHIPGRSIVRYAKSADGKLLIDGDAFRVEVVEGAVSVARKPV